MSSYKRTTDIEESCRIAAAHAVFGHLLKAALDRHQPGTEQGKAARRAAFCEDGELFRLCYPLLQAGEVERVIQLLHRFAHRVYE